MSADHFSAGEMPHQPIRFLPDELMSQVEANVTYACTDVLLRNSETGDVFLGDRQTEPQIGPWLVGGRDEYGKGINENAHKQVIKDLGLDVAPERFQHIATYSTDFPIASPDREDHGRHTVNAVMLVDLKPEEVKTLNERIAAGEIRDEYSSGRWYRPSEIADNESDFPYALKQMVRDLYVHDIAARAILEDAYEEKAVRDKLEEEERQEAEERERIANIALAFKLSHEEATDLERRGGTNTAYAIIWTRRSAEKLGSDALSDTLKEMIDDKRYGDVQISKRLTELGLEKPLFNSDNGPALRSVLRTGAVALEIDKKYSGDFFAHVARFEEIAKQATAHTL